MYYKGDILLPLAKVRRKNWLNGLYHSAVVWDDYNDGSSDFNGIMLTHSPPNIFFHNIIMAPNHFESGHQIIFDNTHFVNQIFIKFMNWGPFDIVGRLTSDGITFIETNLTHHLNPIEFATYHQLSKV